MNALAGALCKAPCTSQEHSREAQGPQQLLRHPEHDWIYFLAEALGLEPTPMREIVSNTAKFRPLRLMRAGVRRAFHGWDLAHTAWCQEERGVLA
jgi:hypothetical protein